jgi:hypothetical protein
MKHKLIIFLFVVTTGLSAFGGLASFLAAAPAWTDLAPTVQSWPDEAETAPIMVARRTSEGNSWGGR